MGKGVTTGASAEPKLEEYEKEIIRGIGTRVEYPRGQVIFSPGSPAGNVCLIESGSVRIYSLGGDGQRTVEGVRRAGELLGLAEAICGVPWTRYNGAIDDVALVSVLKEDFQNLLACDPFILKKILGILAFRLHLAEARIFNLIFSGFDDLSGFNH